jgi:hypothetical protein
VRDRIGRIAYRRGLCPEQCGIGHRLALRVADGYEAAKSRHLSMDLIDTTADIVITGREGLVKFQKRAHNLLVIAAGFDKTEVVIP